MNKLYVLVRGDLSKSQQAVQASHAVAEFMLYSNEEGCRCGRCDHKYWTNGTIVLLKVDNQEDIDIWNHRVAEWKYPFAIFYEPDIDSHTAIAIYDKDGELSERLKDLPLL